jgi:hypothetical protein
MTQYLSKKPFTVKTGGRRDCDHNGHWPRVSKRSGYECVFCGKSCTVDGRSNNTSTENPTP